LVCFLGLVFSMVDFRPCFPPVTPEDPMGEIAPDLALASLTREWCGRRNATGQTC